MLHFCRCIPFRYRNCDDTSDAKPDPDKEVEVLMINSPSGPGLLFPKVWYFKIHIVIAAEIKEDKDRDREEMKRIIAVQLLSWMDEFSCNLILLCMDNFPTLSHWPYTDADLRLLLENQTYHLSSEGLITIRLNYILWLDSITKILQSQQSGQLNYLAFWSPQSVTHMVDDD